MTSDVDVPRDRIAGVLVGAACGTRWAPGTNLVPTGTAGGSRHDRRRAVRIRSGEWTDDTSMAVAIAEVVRTGLDLRGSDAQDLIVQRWLDWSHTAKDIGNQTRAVLGATRRRPSAKAARIHAQAHHDRSGRSGGTAPMRTAPVALGYLDDPDGLAQAARAISDLTHYDRDAGDACVLWSLAIRHAIATGEFDARAGIDWLPAVTRDRWNTPRGCRTPDARRFRPQRVGRRSPTGSMVSYHPHGCATGRPEHWVIPGRASTARTRGRRAGGHDTDTVAAIAGGLLRRPLGSFGDSIAMATRTARVAGPALPGSARPGQVPGDDRRVLRFDHLRAFTSRTRTRATRT